MAITTRISTGTTVQSTSSVVLCVTLDGTGFRFSLNRHITYSNRIITKAVIRKMMMLTKSWTQRISSAIGVTASWKVICLGEGCPDPACAVAERSIGQPAASVEQVALQRPILVMRSAP